MVPALLGASRVHSPLSSAAPRDDAPGPGLQVRRRASADLGPVHRQVDRRREQEHGGARRGREAAEGQGARRGRGQAAPHPRGQREDQESLNLDVGACIDDWTLFLRWADAMVGSWRGPFTNASKPSSYGGRGIAARASLERAEYRGRQFVTGCVGLLV